jgi:hypothetical protein
MNIQEWCEYCSGISYFGQIIPNIFSFNSDNRYGCIYYNNKGYDCEMCDKCWSSCLFKHGQDCYQISSGLVESTLNKKPISTLYLPWWDNFDSCVVCYQELKYIHQKSKYYCQKWCYDCYIIYTGCRYCLTTNIIFGITGQSQCKKCKRFVTIDITNMSNGNCTIDEFLAFTMLNNSQQHWIAANGANFTPLKVYKFIENSILSFKAIKWIPYSQIKNLSKIAEGGFSTIYKASWSDWSNEDIEVAVKKLHDSQNISKYFLNEVISNIIHCILKIYLTKL